MYGLFNICAFYYSKGWLRVYYGLDLLLSKLSKAQVAEISVSGTVCIWLAECCLSELFLLSNIVYHLRHTYSGDRKESLDPVQYFNIYVMNVWLI